jgi:hypothetical protein
MRLVVPMDLNKERPLHEEAAAAVPPPSRFL